MLAPKDVAPSALSEGPDVERGGVLIGATITMDATVKAAVAVRVTNVGQTRVAESAPAQLCSAC